MPSPDDASPAPSEHPPPAMQKKRGRGDGAEEDGAVPDVRPALPVCNRARDVHEYTRGARASAHARARGAHHHADLALR